MYGDENNALYVYLKQSESYIIWTTFNEDYYEGPSSVRIFNFFIKAFKTYLKKIIIFKVEKIVCRRFCIKKLSGSDGVLFKFFCYGIDVLCFSKLIFEAEVYERKF